MFNLKHPITDTGSGFCVKYNPLMQIKGALISESQSEAFRAQTHLRMVHCDSKQLKSLAVAVVVRSSRCSSSAAAAAAAARWWATWRPDSAERKVLSATQLFIAFRCNAGVGAQPIRSQYPQYQSAPSAYIIVCSSRGALSRPLSFHRCKSHFIPSLTVLFYLFVGETYRYRSPRPSSVQRYVVRSIVYMYMYNAHNTNRERFALWRCVLQSE